MNVVFDLQLEESHEPRYRGFRIVKKWFIKGLYGEPADPELPLSLASTHGPESIILAQLAGLKTQDPRHVFKFASPKNKAAFNGNVELFSDMLGSEAYAPLLGHFDSKILRSTQMTEQDIDGGDEKIMKRGCWMTEAVYPLGYGAGFLAL